MKILNIIYANTYDEYCQILRDLVSSQNLKRHHAAQSSATMNMQYYNAIAVFVPYEGKFGKGFKLIKRHPRVRNNRMVVYYIEQSN